MAAGGVGVSRRKGSSNGYSSSGRFDHTYKNGAHVGDLKRKDEGGVFGCKNGYHISSSGRSSHIFSSGRSSHIFSSGRSSHPSRNGVSCREEEREFGKLRAKYGFENLEDGEIPSCDDGIQLPAEKKRKFSPVIWDVDDKKADSMNTVVETSRAFSVSARLETVSADKAYITGNAADANVSSSPARLYANVSNSPTRLSPCAVENYANDDMKHSQGYVDEDEKEFTQVRHISTSRWASDSGSPTNAGFSDDKGGPGGDRSTSSGSVERYHCGGSSLGDEDSEDKLENEDLMDDNRVRDVNDDANRMDDDCCQVEEPAAASQSSVNMLEGCRSVYEYERLNEINEGTYGKVYKALYKKTGEHVALKKVKLDIGRDRSLEDYGFPITSLREINILLSLHHPSIVNVKEVVVGGLDSVYMVMEYMEHDLKGFIQARKQPLSISEVKCLMLQLLEGVGYLHDNWVLHRDLKTSNLLLNNEGDLKICDFGMARQYGSPLKPYTSLVVTLWYRAPELLLGAKQYSTAVDMWSVGCIMAELLSKEPIFKGKTEIDQLRQIFGILGTPNEMIWPGLSKLPLASKANFVRQPYNLLRKKFPAAPFLGAPYLSDLGLDLLDKLLTYDPEKRISADDALNHAWFHEIPLPASKEFMPTLPPQYAKKK